jgi:hypothetical protein
MKIVKITILLMAIAIAFKAPMVVNAFGIAYATIYVVVSCTFVAVSLKKIFGFKVRSKWSGIFFMQALAVFWPVIVPFVLIFRKGK